MSKLPKFEIELPAAPKSTKLSLSERDIAMATMYVCPLGEFLLIIVFSAVMIGGVVSTQGCPGSRSLGTQEKDPPSPLSGLMNVESSSSSRHSFLI